MNEILESLRLWREERGLDKIEFNLDEQVSFILEEVTEYLRAKDEYEKVDALCDICVFALNGLSLSKYNCMFYKWDHQINQTIYTIIEEMADTIYEKWHINFINSIDISKDILKDMGYDFEECMKETIKEINSRKGAMNIKSGKWEKFKDEESKKLWYKANYSKCKLN